jgi:hypothetical protein
MNYILINTDKNLLQHSYCDLIYIIIIDKTALFEPHHFLEDSGRFVYWIRPSILLLFGFL